MRSAHCHKPVQLAHRSTARDTQQAHEQADDTPGQPTPQHRRAAVKPESTCNSHAIPKKLNKTSYSSRESLSGALVEYSFVQASADANDGLPRGLRPCSPCPHSTDRPRFAPDRPPRAPSLRLLSSLCSPSSSQASCAPPYTSVPPPCLTHLTVANFPLFRLQPRTLLFVLSELGLLEMCHHPVIAATLKFSYGKHLKVLLKKKNIIA